MCSGAAGERNPPKKNREQGHAVMKRERLGKSRGLQAPLDAGGGRAEEHLLGGGEGAECERQAEQGAWTGWGSGADRAQAGGPRTRRPSARPSQLPEVRDVTQGPWANHQTRPSPRGVA